MVETYVLSFVIEERRTNRKSEQMGVNFVAIVNSSHEFEDQMDIPWKRHAGLGGRGARRGSARTRGLLPDVLRDPARRLEPGGARGEHQAGRLGVRNAQGLPDALSHRSGIGSAVAKYQIFIILTSVSNHYHLTEMDGSNQRGLLGHES